MRILCIASLRRDPVVFAAHARTLKWQRLPDGVRLDFAYVDDLEDGQEACHDTLRSLNAKVFPNEDKVAVLDFSDKHPATHLWQLSAFDRVARNKQLLLDYALEQGYDYVWVCDTDLILDPYTLWSLIYADQQVTAAVYWTKWQNEAGQYAGPQTWLRHPYQLDGRGLNAQEFRHRLSDRQLVRVWGAGACMLVRAECLKAGVRYHPLLPELVAAGGMMAGEDRTFSVLCERLHIPMWADAWPDIFHAYRPGDKDLIPHYLEEFGAERSLYPGYGDLVSFIVEPMEDPHAVKQHVRGRLGGLGILPEIEAALHTMCIGDAKIAAAAFPVHYPLTHTGHPQAMPPLIQYAGTKKMLNITLVDHRPYGYAPVLREEYGRIGNVGYDSLGYTPEQIRYLGSASVPALRGGVA